MFFWRRSLPSDIPFLLWLLSIRFVTKYYRRNIIHLSVVKWIRIVLVLNIVIISSWIFQLLNLSLCYLSTLIDEFIRFHLTIIYFSWNLFLIWRKDQITNFSFLMKNIKNPKTNYNNKCQMYLKHKRYLICIKLFYNILKSSSLEIHLN